MNPYRRVTLACYFTNMSQAVVGNITPLLFIPLRELYGISYTLLGALVLVNFVTQLAVDLIFSFFPRLFDIAKTVKFTPLVTLAGLVLMALAPVLFPGAVYIGLVFGTIVMAASGGLAEVLISPVIAAIPSDNPGRSMSMLHSIYAWGVVLVVVVSTLFLLVSGYGGWQWLLVFWALLPLMASLLFRGTTIPLLEADQKKVKRTNLLGQPILLLCFACIFLGGASECSMAQWSSGFLERGMGIDKVWGDLLGVAMFGAALGLGRFLYGKFGKSIYRVLFFGSIGAAVCYLVVALTNLPALSIIACAFTGFCVSMLWPGTLIAASEHAAQAGVTMFAMMAAAGDLGGATGPWLVGRVTDLAMQSDGLRSLSATLGITSEQLGLKCGMLAAMIFPVMAVVLFGILYRISRRKRIAAGSAPEDSLSDSSEAT